ncbi:fimbria/pilus outer membrane usher protein [Pseudomonas promysalinigenes]|uniref:Fimbrial biogenesis outer membrane usher protein n=1 Tax=Pseudomonas promysalinigenes TaxID=485898 RepID=A0ABY6ARL2_9PSED|nr:fimbria/pilus outer membrane usher protein [Pseudomonas promysalinigenes]UXH41805.1 fimbrial biogenesis outer membrane usher protein [Pseudomonas promysalinigenes]
MRKGRTNNWLRRIPIVRMSAFTFTFYTCSVQAEFSFDPSFLEIGGGRSGDAVAAQVSALSEGQLPGVYKIGLAVNGKAIDEREVRFIREPSDQPKTMTGLFPCFSVESLKELGVDAERLAKASLYEAQCVAFSGSLAGVTYDYVFGKQQLDIQVPQAFIGEVPLEVRRRHWSDGERVAFANYSLSASHQDTTRSRQESQFGSVQSGINAGAWRFRNFSTYQKNGATSGEWKSVDTYVQRALGDTMAIATVGDGSTSSDLFDTISYRGVSVATDLDMLPDSARNFAPVIRGIANGRSLVTLRQRGYVISEQWVPSGPFALRNLYSTPNNGDIEVTVEGPNGDRQVYTQSFSSVPYMLREGQHSYELTLGQYRSASTSTDLPKPMFAQASYRRGVASGTTLLAGSIVSADYHSALFGVAQDIEGFGAVSVDVTHAVTQGLKDKPATGQSYRFRYSKSIETTDTNFSLLGYRYSTAGYYSFNEAVNLRATAAGIRYDDDLLGSALVASDYFAGHMKSAFTANVSQQFSTYGSLFANVSKTRYWNQAKSSTSVQLGYNFSVGSASYTLGLAQTSGAGQSVKSISLGVSLPLGGVSSSRRVSAGASHDSLGNASNNINMSDSVLEDNALTYNVGLNQRKQQGDQLTGASLAARYSAANAVWHGSYTSDQNVTQLDYGVEGGLVATSDSFMFTQPLGETNIIVSTPGAEGVGIRARRGVRTNSSGYTVLPSAQPYRSNKVSLNTDTLSDTTDISNLVQDVVPTRGAFVIANFETRNGRRLLIKLATPEGVLAPFASQANLYDQDGTLISSAMVADNGRVFMTGVPEHSTLTVDVDGKTWCRATVDLNDFALKGEGVEQITMRCPGASETAARGNES